MVWESLPQEELLAELDLEERIRIPQVDSGGEGRSLGSEEWHVRRQTWSVR